MSNWSRFPETCTCPRLLPTVLIFDGEVSLQANSSGKVAVVQQVHAHQWTSLLAKPDPVMQPLILVILQKNGAMDPSISSDTCLPEGLQSVLQQWLLPQLPLQALQSLAQACQDTKRLVQSAQASVWHSALGQGRSAGSL